MPPPHPSCEASSITPSSAAAEGGRARWSLETASTRKLARAMAAGLGGDTMIGGMRGSEVREGTRVRISVSDARYNGCEGVVCRGATAGRIGVELTLDSESKKKLSVTPDSLHVLPASSSSSDASNDPEQGYEHQVATMREFERL